MTFHHCSDVELLSLLIGKRTADKVYSGRLAPLFAWGSLGDAPHPKIAVARELVQRALDEELRRGDALANPSAVRDYLRLLFFGREHESFIVIFLDGQHRVVDVEELFRGTVKQTAVYPREVVKRALRHNASAVIFAHNHPSGVAEPSGADQTLTRTLKESLALVDVDVLDHFVVGSGSSIMSFAERGLL